MALKFKAAAKADIPAGFETAYVERDGAFFLDCEGAVKKAKADEFRANRSESGAGTGGGTGGYGTGW